MKRLRYLAVNIYLFNRTNGWLAYVQKKRATTTAIATILGKIYDDRNLSLAEKKKKKKFFTILKINLYFQKGKTSWIDEDEFLAGSTLIAQFFFQRLPIRSFFHLRSVKEKRKEEENYSLSNML